jgi:hypothetical protein
MSTFLDEGRAPVVIDYAYHTASDKRIPVTLSGTFLGLTLSGADIEIGAVEIKDEDSENRAVVHLNADDFANGNVLVTAAEVMGYDAAANNWNRVRNVFTDLDDVDEDIINPALAVGAVVLGLDESDQFDRMRGTAEYGLEVDATRIQGTSAISGFTMIRDALGHTAEVTADGFLAISGIVNIGQDIEIGAVEIKDAASNDRAFVGYAIDDDIQQGLSTLSQTLAYNPDDGSWYRVRVANPATDGYDEGYMNPALAVGSVTLGYNATSGIMGYDRIRGDTKYGLDVDVTRVQTTVPVSGTINNVVEVDATGQGDVPITLDGELVTIAGTVAVSGVMTDVVVTNITGFDDVKGQALMAESFPVVIASDQSTLPVSGIILNVVEVDATGQGDIPVTLDSELITIAGTTAVSGIITNVVDVNVTAMPIQPITISGDIEIGAVEIKNATDDTRAVVTPDGFLAVSGYSTLQVTGNTTGLIYPALALEVDDLAHFPTDREDVLATAAFIFAEDPITTEYKPVREAPLTDSLDYVGQASLVTAAFPYLLNGSGYFDRARGDIANGLDVDVTRIQGTTAVSGTVIVSEITNPLTISGSINIAGTTAVSGIINNIVTVSGMSNMYSYDEFGGYGWTPVPSIYPTEDDMDPDDLQPAPFMGVQIHALNEDTSYLERVRGSQGYGLETDVTRIQGTTAISGIINNVVSVDATGQGDVPITLDGEEITIAGTAAVSGYLTGGSSYARVRYDQDGAEGWSNWRQNVNPILGFNSNEYEWKKTVIDCSDSLNLMAPMFENKTINVMEVFLTVSGTTQIQFLDGDIVSGGTPLTGKIILDDSGAGFVLPVSPFKNAPHFVATSGLILAISPATYVGGFLNYWQEEF